MKGEMNTVSVAIQAFMQMDTRVISSRAGRSRGLPHQPPLQWLFALCGPELWPKSSLSLTRKSFNEWFMKSHCLHSVCPHILISCCWLSEYFSATLYRKRLTPMCVCVCLGAIWGLRGKTFLERLSCPFSLNWLLSLTNSKKNLGWNFWHKKFLLQSPDAAKR